MVTFYPDVSCWAWAMHTRRWRSSLPAIDRRQAAIRGGSEADGRHVAGHERIRAHHPDRMTATHSVRVEAGNDGESLRRARRGPAREAGMTGTMRPQLQPPLTPFVDPLPLPRRILAGQGGGELTVRIRAAAHRFHRDLPESRVWAYEGLVPGPTIEAERGQPVRVCWRNEIDQPYPVVVTLAPAETDGDGVPVQCLPGLSGGTPDPDAAALTGYTVVHLHGAVTAAPSDGSTENVFAPGQHAISDYPMDQRAALLWYHDHVMGVTRLTVYAGLAGLWIIRDQREHELGLPEGPPFEVPLLVRDRNFGQLVGGRLTGELVHKTDPGTMEAFAPFTVVGVPVVLRKDPTNMPLTCD
jgi:FtsP/CotA-like multicopper oxidase with cupredoxin domain